MVARGLVVLTLLWSCVLPLPVTPSQLENEDVKVMKCIVEVLTDVLSRPRPLPVSQECLVTLRKDDRLVSVLRHHNFLKVLQDIAVEGHQERAQQQRDAGTPEPTKRTPQAADDVADRSMLEALGGPGERSILAQKRRPRNGDGEEEKEDCMGAGQSRDDSDSGEVKKKREHEEAPGSLASASVEEWSDGKAQPREEDEEDYGGKRVASEENMITDKKGAGSGKKRRASMFKSKEKKSVEEDEEEKDKRSAHSSCSPKQEVEQEEEEDKREMKRESKESHKRWTKRGKSLGMRKKPFGKEAWEEVPHHSKEVSEEEEDEKKKRRMQKSPEEKELQMIARGRPKKKRGSEEEGSGSWKSKEPEIESLAAIESELENIGQKLHGMRRG